MRYAVKVKALLLLCLQITIFAQEDSSRFYRGDSHLGSVGVKESVKQIMMRLPVHSIARPQVKKARKVPRKNLPQNPQSALVQTSLDAAALQECEKRQELRNPTVQTVALNFLGAQYSESGFVPPDSDGAVGMQQYFLVASGIVKTFNLTTGALDGIIDTSLDNFFASVLPSGTYVGDIRVFFDTTAQRFIVLGRTSDTATERIVIAVSDSAVIASQTNFLFYYITTGSFTGGLELDYPTLGCDNNAVYSGANLFDSSSGAFENSVAIVIQKSSLLNGGPVVYTAFMNLINFNTGTGMVSP